MNIRTLALALLLASAPAFAGEVDGKWTGSIDSPTGPVQVDYQFKSEGNTVTGVAIGPDGSTLPFKNVKLDGHKISFSLDVDFGQGPTTFNYTGTVEAGLMKLHTEFMGQAIDFSVKKTT